MNVRAMLALALLLGSGAVWAAVDISIREIGLAHVCKGGSLGGSVCDHTDPNACPDGGTCVLKLGAGPKFKGVLTVVSQDNPTNFWGDALNSPSIAVTLQVKGRFGDVKNPILAASFQPNDIPNNILNYPPTSDRESQTMDESTIVQLPVSGGILSRPFTFEGQLNDLFGATGRIPVIVAFSKPIVTDNTLNDMPSVFSAKVLGFFMDPS